MQGSAWLGRHLGCGDGAGLGVPAAEAVPGVHLPVAGTWNVPEMSGQHYFLNI